MSASDGLPYMPLWIDDLSRSPNWTSRDAEEMGVYMHLLVTGWSWDGLPAEEARVRRLVEPLLVKREWRAIWGWIQELFPLAEDGKRRNRKQEEVRVRSAEAAAKRSAAGKRGAAALHRQSHGKRMAMPKQSHAVAMPSPNPTDLENLEDRADSQRAHARESEHAHALEDLPDQDPEPGNAPPPPTVEASDALPPVAWDFGSERKNAAWRDWLTHTGQQDNPPTEKALSKHWHKLRDLPDALAVAVVSGAIEYSARTFTDAIVAKAREQVAAGPAAALPSHALLDEVFRWPMPESLGEEFRPDWGRWLEHLSHQRKAPTEGQVRMHLEKLGLLDRDGARESVDYCIQAGLTAFSAEVLQRARERRGSVLPGPGSKVSHDEHLRLWGEA